YKYPQAEYPYANLVNENRARGGRGYEYELLDTGVFNENRYFDVFVEYAKAGPEDLCIRIETFNRGPEAAPLHILPHLWFRNTRTGTERAGTEPVISAGATTDKFTSLVADDAGATMLKNIPFEYRLGKRYLYCEPQAKLLFTDNETNAVRVWGERAVPRK